MSTESNALPWFPLTPDYIEKYLDSVIKYLKDQEGSPDEDKSFRTTVSLLAQRSQELYMEILETPLAKAEQINSDTLARYIKIAAADLLVKIADGGEGSAPVFILLLHLISLDQKENSDELAALMIKAMRAERITDAGIGFDDIVMLDIQGMSKKVCKAVMVLSKDTFWFEDHGTIRLEGESLSVFDMNRRFIQMKQQMGGAFKKEALIGEDTVCALTDKKDKAAFSFARFANSAADVKPSESVEIKKRTYVEGDEVSVRVTSCGYDIIYAETTDPSYETVSGQIVIKGASNVRGIYMTDIVRNVHPGSILNVVYEGGREFSIDSTIINFIRSEYWENDEEEQKYSRMNAILLFPQHGNIMNTWLTEYGFLVRSGYEDYDRYHFAVLEITNYNDDLDWFTECNVLDVEPEGEPIEEKEAKNSFIQYMLYKQKRIVSPELPKVEVKCLDHSSVTLLHRTFAVKDGFSKSDQIIPYLTGCMVLATVAGDSADIDYYSVKTQYTENLLQFAANKFTSIRKIDRKGIDETSTLKMTVMTDILSEYDKAEESELLAKTISECPDTEISTVAKLIQAANRFKGSQFLNTMRESLHREICTILEVSDAIEVPESTYDDDFPFDPEGPAVEHKVSWVFDNHDSIFNETTQSAKIMKSICAFMNNLHEEGGGHIYIGTDEPRHYVCGFQNDIDALVAKGELLNTGDVKDEYLRHISGIIKNKFPETYDKVRASIICDGKVIDLDVRPADVGVVYFNGIAYEKFNSSSRPMREDKKESIISKKFLMHFDLADKIEAVRKGIHRGTYVKLKGYDSSNSNTDEDRKLEVFAFTDDARRDAVWAFDPKDPKHKNKVFLLKRAESVEVLDEKWQYAKQHRTLPLDIFGYSGDEEIPFRIGLNSTSAKNLFVEQYPDAKKCMVKTGKTEWVVEATLYSRNSLEAAASFYLGYSGTVDISGTPELLKIIPEKLNALLEKF